MFTSVGASRMRCRDGGSEMSKVQVLTVEQVAERVQLSTSTVMRAIRNGELEASQLTRSRGGWRVRETAIAAWLDARSNRGRPGAIAEVRVVEPSELRRPSSRSTMTPAHGR